MYHRLFLLLLPLLACNAPAPKPESAPAATIRVPDQPLAVLDTPIRRGRFLDVETPIEERIEKDSVFRNYIKKEILQSPRNPAFRRQKGTLQEVRRVVCDATQYLFVDTIAGKSIRLNIKLKKFKKSEHKIKYKDNYCELIDGLYPNGGYYACSGNMNEIRKVEFSISGKSININKYFKNLYHLDVDDEVYPVLYTDKKAEYFYLYLAGGNAVTCYFTKHVLDSTGVVTRIVLDIIDNAIVLSR